MSEGFVPWSTNLFYQKSGLVTPSTTPSIRHASFEGVPSLNIGFNTRYSCPPPRKCEVLLHSAPPSVRRSVKMPRVRVCASAFSFRPAVNFCSSVGGYDERKLKDGRKKASFAGVGKCPLSRQEVPLNLISFILLCGVLTPSNCGPRHHHPLCCGRVPFPQHPSNLGFALRREKESPATYLLSFWAGLIVTIRRGNSSRVT